MGKVCQNHPELQVCEYIWQMKFGKNRTIHQTSMPNFSTTKLYGIQILDVMEKIFELVAVLCWQLLIQLLLWYFRKLECWVTSWRIVTTVRQIELLHWWLLIRTFEIKYKNFLCMLYNISLHNYTVENSSLQIYDSYIIIFLCFYS